MHLTKLRHKSEETPSDSCYMITVHRMGYEFIGGQTFLDVVYGLFHEPDSALQSDRAGRE